MYCSMRQYHITHPAHYANIHFMAHSTVKASSQADSDRIAFDRQQAGLAGLPRLPELPGQSGLTALERLALHGRLNQIQGIADRAHPDRQYPRWQQLKAPPFIFFCFFFQR